MILLCRDAAPAGHALGEVGLAEEGTRESHVCNLGTPVPAQQHVGGLDVQVHHTVAVQVEQPPRYVQRYATPPAPAPRPPCDCRQVDSGQPGMHVTAPGSPKSQGSLPGLDTLNSQMSDAHASKYDRAELP